MRRILIGFVVLAAVLIGGDRLAVHYVENKVATYVMHRENLESKPNVEIKGFPFLTQVLSNDISKVTMTLPSVKAKTGRTKEVRIEDVSVTFTDVHKKQRLTEVTATQMTGSALIPYSAVSALGPFTAAYGGQTPQDVGVISLKPDKKSGLPRTLSVDVGVAVSDGTITFVGTNGATRIAPIPPNLRPLLTSLVSSSHPVYGLPTSFTITALDIQQDGIHVSLAGRNVEMSR